MRLSLRAGERIYINGAVLRVDRKVAIELMNDATFLLESHVLQAEDATTPLRQLYFAAQTMLIDPGQSAAARALYDGIRDGLLAASGEAALHEGLSASHALVENGRLFEALKLIRGLYPLEAALMKAGEAPPARGPSPSLSALARRPRGPDRPRERAAVRPPAAGRRPAATALPARDPEA
ncbi:flagellar biosynthesis repressor FlbT [Methylobacterium frigidaeris]|uniref:Probable flagellum biosynthesis repressor protein FlbT n=1 Tax=Methylobacterium frigidaeris TaxID=2038277 RepID=A0AA37M6K1_9HYPH|nr:flagellar biosynthesis repressor FlbT [Methylobacterium frigidaeris]PIK70545.1 flagellar biosynthesis repressor FlbT [Methylobacterium frigidaeris]GJD63851.1 flagellum biosynthesis repressor protein FlbT [Methylobacterium frigidaeris]